MNVAAWRVAKLGVKLGLKLLHVTHRMDSAESNRLEPRPSDRRAASTYFTRRYCITTRGW